MPSRAVARPFDEPHTPWCFNGDHVVLAPQGVYVVETKGYTKLVNVKGREGATVPVADRQCGGAVAHRPPPMQYPTRGRSRPPL